MQNDIILIGIKLLKHTNNNDKNYFFKKIDLSEEVSLFKVLRKFKPDAIINCAAETHVDRSILSPKIFINSNIVSTLNLLNFNVVKKKLNLFMFLQMRFMVPLKIIIKNLILTLSTTQKVPTQQAKQHLIFLLKPLETPTILITLSLIALTILDLISIQKN